MAAGAKVDMKKEMKELYRPSAKKVSLVDVPAMNFLMIDGKGYPSESAEFQEDIGALYGLAYTLKFMMKAEGFDFAVMPLETVYWTAGRKLLDLEDKAGWNWTLMIAVPPQIKKKDVNKAAAQLKEKKDPVGLARVRFEKFREGKAVQIMHVGPYSEEGPTIARMLEWAADNGLEPAGRHHEIYLGDPRRTAPEKLRTIVRQPVSKK